MLLTRTNSKTAFSGGNIPVFRTTQAEDDLFNMGVSSWIETGERFIRTDPAGRVTGLIDRANSDVLTPAGAAPKIINAGISALSFDKSPMLGNVDVFGSNDVQTLITVCRAAPGNVDVIVGSQAADARPLMLFVDRPDDSAMRYLQRYPDNQINSTKPVKNIGWFSCVISYSLLRPQAVFYINGEQVTKPGPVTGSLSKAANAKRIAIGGAGVAGAQLPGTFDFALSITLPDIAAHEDPAALAKINALLTEFMSKLK